MNESMVYADNFSKTFAGEGDFLNFLKNREEETTWKKETSSSLRFEAIRRDTQRAEELASEFKARGKEDVISDTLDGTQLILKADGECIPVRNCAIKTVNANDKMKENAEEKM